MMRHVRVFETWNDNEIDHTLFKSGKAKYSPKVSNKKIYYKTGNALPFYTAEIHQIGHLFFVDITKHKLDGSQIKVKHRKKKTLKTAHDYVREYLNDRVEHIDQEREDDIEQQEKDADEVQVETDMNPMDVDTTVPEPDFVPQPLPEPIEPRNKVIIRNFGN